MALFDDITKKAVKLTEQTLDKSQELAGTAKSKLRARNLSSNCDDLYCQLGKYYYDSIQGQDSIDEEIANYRMQIYELEEEIKELQKESD